jgi:hypothetical protein
MSDLRDTIVNIQLVTPYGSRRVTEIPVTAYADESGTVSKVEIQLDDVLKFIICLPAYLGPMISEELQREADRIAQL